MKRKLRNDDKHDGQQSRSNFLFNRSVFNYISPLLFVFSFLIIFGALLYTIYRNSQKEQTNNISVLSERIGKEIEVKLKGNLDYLNLLAKERAAGNLSEKMFQSQAGHFLNVHPEFINITWIDSSYAIKTVCPLKGNSQIIGLHIELPEPKYASRRAKSTRQSVYTKAFEAIQAKSSFEVWVPVFNENQFLGLFAGVYSCEQILKNSIPDKLFYQIHVQLLDATSTVHSEFPKIEIKKENISLDFPLSFLANGMKIRVNMVQSSPYSWTIIILLSICLILVSGFAYSLWKINIESIKRKKTQDSLKQNEFSLKKQNEEYHALNKELVKLNRKIQKKNKDLKIVKERAEESDQLKTAFLQNMSHEIRTPMNAIVGFSDLLSDNLHNKEKLSRFTKIINQCSNDLLNIINDILDIAKIESGQLSVAISPCNLSKFCDELKLLFEDYQARTEDRNVQFQFNVLSDITDLAILTDQIKLKQIFINLVDNACKFTKSGTVTGACKLDANNNLIFFVSDTGIGIPLDKQSVIFDRFMQVQHPVNKNIGGTGLGLSIVKGFVEILGGKISLESELGKGSTFLFSFPKIYLQKVNNEKPEQDKKTRF